MEDLSDYFDKIGATKDFEHSDKLLVERGSTHGRYDDGSRIIQSLKSVIHDEYGWTQLSNPQKEAVDMICTKLGRILSGNPDSHEHWEDIQGYAKLVMDRIK